jgi:hypothetical protein
MNPKFRHALMRWMSGLYSLLWQAVMVLHSGKHKCWYLHNILENELEYLRYSENRLYDKPQEDILEHVIKCKWKTSSDKRVLDGFVTLRSEKIAAQSAKREEEARELEEKKRAAEREKMDNCKHYFIPVHGTVRIDGKSLFKCNHCKGNAWMHKELAGLINNTNKDKQKNRKSNGIQSGGDWNHVA